MRPFFTVHAGEYLVGSEIERQFKQVNVWVPSRDTGIDLLMSSRKNRRTVSVQVKFSKDFLPHMKPELQKSLRACGWWTINRDKLQTSPADYWVFVLLGFERHTTDFVIIRPSEFWKRHQASLGAGKIIQSYLWVTKDDRCWEARGLPVTDQQRIADGRFRDSSRDLTRWLNAWAVFKKLST